MPQQLILPATVRKGMVVNVAEMRLYYYPPDSQTVEVFPIGIGQAGRETPRNWVTTVERKQEAPTWTPTPNTRREYAKRGESLPAFIPAGPENPMGLYAIYIGRLYAIHGTNANFGIGLRVSQGCIRLRDNDIKYLFDNVPVGTRVQIIDQPVKYTTEPDGSNWLEVHEPLSRNRAEFESDRKVPLPITPALRAFYQRTRGRCATCQCRYGTSIRNAGEYQSYSILICQLECAICKQYKWRCINTLTSLHA